MIKVIVKKTKKVYARVDKVKDMVKDGWKIIDSDFSDMSPSTAVRKLYALNKDLVLMEKEV